MVVPGLQDISAAVSIAKKVYDYGFSQVNGAELQYDDFGEEVKHLRDNLESLVQWGTRLQEQAARGPPTLQQSTLNAQFNYETLVDVCGDFRATLSESETLLKENLSYGQQRGMTTPLTNIKWNLAIRDTVERFSKRLSNHNQSITALLERLNLELSQNGNTYNELAYQSIMRGQERIANLLGASVNPSPLELEPLKIPSHVEERLIHAYELVFPRISHRRLTLKDGMHGVNHHLNKSTSTGRPGDRQDVSPIDRYLHVMRSAYLLHKMKATSEYNAKVNVSRELLWISAIEKLEERCRSQLRLYSDSVPESSRLPTPTDQEIRCLFQDQVLFSFENDELTDVNNPEIPLEGNEEISYLTLSSSSTVEEHKLGILRLSPLELELRSTTTALGGARVEQKQMHVHLAKALLVPIWAKVPSPLVKSIVFRGDDGNSTKSAFEFCKWADLHEFQQAILGYRVSYECLGKDVKLWIRDKSLSLKSIEVWGKIEIWQDEEIDSAAAIMGRSRSPSSAASMSSPTTAPSTLPSFLASQSSLSPGSPRQASMFSMPSTLSISSANTAATRSTFVSTHTVPIGTPDSNTFSCRYNKVTEPVLVFIIRGDGKHCAKFSLLAIKMTDSTAVDPDCNRSSCARSREGCLHATVKSKEKHLTAMRASFPENEGWNLAALGKYQQNISPRVEKADKLKFVHLEFPSKKDRDEFQKRFAQVREIWIRKRKGEMLDRREFRKVSVVS